jgi:hypothetical protein
VDESLKRSSFPAHATPGIVDISNETPRIANEGLIHRNIPQAQTPVTDNHYLDSENLDGIDI